MNWFQLRTKKKVEQELNYMTQKAGIEFRLVDEAKYTKYIKNETVGRIVRIVIMIVLVGALIIKWWFA